MACRRVDDCSQYDQPCYETLAECECGCPGSGKDPNSRECRCIRRKCPAPQEKIDCENENGVLYCTCACPDDPDKCNPTWKVCTPTAGDMTPRCVPPCPPTKIRGGDCGCYCPAGTTEISIPQDDGSTVTRCIRQTYTCAGCGCTEVFDESGEYNTLVACQNDCCKTGCFPIPPPPPGLPVLCADGFTQIGLSHYEFEQFPKCKWVQVTVIWGICPDTPPEPSGTSSSGPEPPLPCCEVPPGYPVSELEIICGYPVPVLTGGYLFDNGPGAANRRPEDRCFSVYTELEWCDACDPVSGLPRLKTTKSYRWNATTCEFEPSPNNDIHPGLPCPGVDPGTSTTSSATKSSSSSEVQSSTSPQSSASRQSSSSSSPSLCCHNPYSVNYLFQAVTTPLNRLKQGDKFRVRVTVSDPAAAEQCEASWQLRTLWGTGVDAKVVTLLDFDIKADDANPRTFVFSSNDLLAAIGLTFETASPGKYYFKFCGVANDCKLTNSACNGTIVVVVPDRSSSSSARRASSSSARRSSSSSRCACCPKPLSINYTVRSNGAFLNNMSPEDTLSVRVTVSDLVAAEEQEAIWELLVNDIPYLAYNVTRDDPNPRTFVISGEQLLRLIGVDPATGDSGDYTFRFCGRVRNCAGDVDRECRGSAIVKFRRTSSSTSRRPTSSTTPSTTSRRSSSSSRRSSSSSRRSISSSSPSCVLYRPSDLVWTNKNKIKFSVKTYAFADPLCQNQHSSSTAQG